MHSYNFHADIKTEQLTDEHEASIITNSAMSINATGILHAWILPWMRVMIFVWHCNNLYIFHDKVMTKQPISIGIPPLVSMSGYDTNPAMSTKNVISGQFKCIYAEWCYIVTALAYILNYRYSNYIAPPEVHEVYTLLRNKADEWDAIGRELGVPHDHCEEIRNKKLPRRSKLEKVLIEWNESQCSDVSWDNIKNVLKRLHYTRLAKKVERKFIQSC